MNLICVLSSADSEMGLESKIAEGWTCEGQQTLSLLNFEALTLFCIISSPFFARALPPVSSHSGPALRAKLAEDYLFFVRVGLVFCWWSLLQGLARTRDQINTKLVETPGPQSAVTVTASCPIS